jgi:hypothetical protein
VRLGALALGALGAIGAASLALGVFTITTRQDRTCQVIYEFVHQARERAGKPGSSGYELYNRLPPAQRRRAIARAREDGRRLLAKLAFCKPDDLPAPAATPDTPARGRGGGDAASRDTGPGRTPGAAPERRPRPERPGRDDATQRPPDARPTPPTSPTNGATSPTNGGSTPTNPPEPPPDPTLLEQACDTLPDLPGGPPRRLC